MSIAFARHLHHRIRSLSGFLGGSYQQHLSTSSSSSSSSSEVIDLRSDTLTMPTIAMREAMASAEVGDDTYDRDPTVERLEAQVSSMLGKESGLFTVSGTMANLLAVLTHCQSRGSEAIVGSKSHVFLCEQGSMAHLAGVHSSVLPNLPDGTFDLDELRCSIRDSRDVHQPITELICIENTQAGVGGLALPQEWCSKLLSFSQSRSIPVHVDGTRLLNAAVAQDTPASDLVRGFSSVCLSMCKCVGAPVGSVLVGEKPFIQQARRYRKALGGSARQVGGLAAAAIVALQTAEERIRRDHSHAAAIAQGVASLGSKYVTADVQRTQTNIVFLRTWCITAEKLCSRLQRVTPDEISSLGFDCVVRCFTNGENVVRLVTHSEISGEQIERAIKKIEFVISSLP